MTPAKLDLNLLLVFDAIYQECNLTRAGARLCLSQPAVSASLARLRDTIGDPLFVRTNHGVAPTQRAKSLAEPLEQALRSIRDLMHDQSVFDAAQSTRAFRLLMPDVGEMNILPRLVEFFQTVAPRVSITTIQILDGTQFRLLEQGRVDLAIGNWSNLTSSRGFRKRLLFRDSFVALVRKGHSLRGPDVTPEELAAASHIVVSRNEHSAGPLDDLFLSRGLRLRVVARIPHYLAVPMMLEKSDLVVIMPAKPAAAFARAGHYRVLPLSVDVPTFDVSLYWHQRFSRDAGLAWLIDTMLDLFADDPSR